MTCYVAVLAPNALEEIKREAGYVAARDVVDTIADALAATVRDVRHVRANRRTVEFSFSGVSDEEAGRVLRQLRHELTRISGCATTIAAVRSWDEQLTEAAILQAERLLDEAVRTGAPVYVGDRSGTTQANVLLRDLPGAMRDGSLSLHYQPKLRSRSGELAGAEALLRWRHPELGPIAPDLFIPAAERSGAIRALTHWVIDRALADQDRLAAAGIALPSHVNISATLVADPSFAAQALEQLGSRVSAIGFEITEGAMFADPEGALANLKRWASAGVRLAIDDYGTGYSSLAYLQRLPVHELKVDKRFVSALSSSARDPLLVRSTIDLAHALEMEVTAEGVECASAAALLQVMRCDLLQGYFLSPPLTLEDFITFARNMADGITVRPQVQSLRKRLADRRAARTSAA